MPMTVEEFTNDWIRRNLERLLGECTPEQRVADLSTEELEKILEQRRAAEAAAGSRKKNGKAARGATKRKGK